MSTDTKNNPIEAARGRQQQAAETAAQLQREIEEKQLAIREANEQAKRAAEDEKAAEHAQRVAERGMKLHRNVSLEGAQRAAEDLLRLFEDSQTRRKDVPADEWWQRLDDIRCRLHSSDVDEDARNLVLAIEFVIGTCDRWAMADRNKKEGRPYGHYPVDDHRTETALAELRRELDGDPPGEMESFFGLFTQNVPPQQMAKMLGLTNAHGNGDLDLLARFFGRMAERAGVQSRRSLAVRRYAGLDDADAWTLREPRVRDGKPDVLVPGVPDLGDGGHPGRRAS